MNYQINPKWNIGGRWAYRTGTLCTPIFHHLDAHIERTFRNNKGLLFFDFLNLHNRDNTSGVEYIPIANSPNFRPEEAEGLGFVPSVGVKFTF